MEKIENGLGPIWFPKWIRIILTKFSAIFFDEAAWNKHDIGYARKYPSRAICDRKFFQAMIRDASRTEIMWKIWFCLFLASFFWAMVRMWGWISYYEVLRKRKNENETV